MLLFKPETPIAEFLKQYRTKISLPTGEWYYSPYWFREKKDGLYAVNFDGLPTELLDEVKKMRDGKAI